MSDPQTGNGGKRTDAMQPGRLWALSVGGIGALVGLLTLYSSLTTTIREQADQKNQIQNLERQLASISSQVSGLNDRLAQGLAPVPTLQERFAYLQPVPQKIAEMDRALVTLQSQAAIVAQGLEKATQEADRRANQYNTSLQQIREMLFSLRIPRNGSLNMVPDLPTLNDFPQKAKQETPAETLSVVRRKDVSEWLWSLAKPHEPQWSVIARTCMGMNPL